MAGTLENRFRFLKEIIEGVKTVFCGPIWVRLSATAYDETGTQNTLQDYQTNCQMVRGTWGGLFRYFYGWFDGCEAQYSYLWRLSSYISAQIKQAVSIPVTAVGFVT